MVVNYKPRPVGLLLFFLVFVVVCMIGMPVWAISEFGVEQSPFAGKLILAPIFGLAYLILLVRTFVFNARVRRDPRAIQWDALGLSLWQDGRAQRLQWPQVREVSVQPSNPSFLKIAAAGPDGRLTRWRFSSSRLQLSGHPLGQIAKQIDQARGGIATPAAAPTAADSAAASTRQEKRVEAARAIVVVAMSVYFVTLAAMAFYLSSSRTMLLTPRDPLLWSAAEIAFLATSGTIFIWYVRTVSRISGMSRRVAIRFLGRVMGPGLFFAAMMGLWAYLAANVYVTARTWGGHVDHGAVLMVVEEPMITHHGRPNVEAHLLDRPGRSVFFTIDEADAQLLRHWHDPGYIDESACVTVPVQWAGYAIRADVTTDTPLPKGNLSRCS